jgi:PKHD-type hydroxylase
MLTTIENVLTPEALASIRALAAEAEFEDGRASATGWAKDVKFNRQIRDEGSAAQQAERILTKALVSNETLRTFTLPAVMQRPRLTRYAEKMNYGYHVDSAFMGEPMARTDVSVTLFISEPSDYDGGELIVDGGWGRMSIKLPAGALVAYPATTLHRVAPVTRGERLVALTWIKSRVRRHDQRELLVDVERLRDAIENGSAQNSIELIAKLRENLHRLWFDP